MAKAINPVENIMLQNFISGLDDGGFHKGMKSMRYLRLTLEEDGHAKSDFTRDFNNLLKSFDEYWKLVEGTMDLDELESSRRSFSETLEGLLGERFSMTMKDRVYSVIHNYTL